jgi:hypothetical protein
MAHCLTQQTHWKWRAKKFFSLLCMKRVSSWDSRLSWHWTWRSLSCGMWHHRFRGTFHLHLLPWRWQELVPPRQWYIYVTLHSVTSQKAVTFVVSIGITMLLSSAEFKYEGHILSHCCICCRRLSAIIACVLKGLNWLYLLLLHLFSCRNF